MNVTVVGTGRMARKMVEAMMTFPELTLHSVVSRTQQKAYLFASEFGFEKSFSSLESALEDEQVDLVYIATPHSEHFGQMLQCIEHRKPVLCEKSFTLNSRQAQTVIDAASSAKVFLCEALWNRFLPSRFALDGVLERNLIGEISMVSASLCYSLTHKSRLSDPALGGGALLDVGIYPFRSPSCQTP